MYGDQSGEFVCGCWDLKGKKKHTVQYTVCNDLLLTHGSKLNYQYFRLLKDIFGVILMSSF